jgi:hypothetical protein
MNLVSVKSGSELQTRTSTLAATKGFMTKKLTDSPAISSKQKLESPEAAPTCLLGLTNLH